MKKVIKKGTKITIKPFKKIKLTLSGESYHKKGNLFFNDLMKNLCGKSFILKMDVHVDSINTINTITLCSYNVSDNQFYWSWHLDWIEIEVLSKKINKLLKY